MASNPPVKCPFSTLDFIRGRENASDFIHASGDEHSGRLSTRAAMIQLQNRYGLGPFMTLRVKTPQNYDKIFTAEFLSDSQIIIGTKCNKLSIFDMNSKKFSSLSSDSKKGIYSIKFNESRTKCAVSGGNLIIFSLPDFKVIHECHGHSDTIFCIDWLNDNNLLSGGRDGKLFLYNFHPDSEYRVTGKLLKTFRGKVRGLNCSSGLVNGVLTTDGYVHLGSDICALNSIPLGPVGKESVGFDIGGNYVAVGGESHIGYLFIIPEF